MSDDAGNGLVLVRWKRKSWCGIAGIQYRRNVGDEDVMDVYTAASYVRAGMADTLPYMPPKIVSIGGVPTVILPEEVACR